MLHRILIPLDVSKTTPVAIETAAKIARDVGAHEQRDSISLLGLGIVDLDQIPSGRFASLVPREKIIEEAREKVEALHQERKDDEQKFHLPSQTPRSGGELR